MNKKAPLLLFILLLANHLGSAQLWKEWFRQKKTQKQYLLEQIALYKTSLQFTKKGYQIAKKGLNTIGNFKNGEFILHKNRFDSLLIVSPHISSLPRLKEIALLHKAINTICQKLPADLQTTGSFSGLQLAYIHQVSGRLYADGQSIVTGLLSVIRDGQLTMDDADRLKRIGFCHQQMQSNYTFAKNFAQQAQMLSVEAKNEKEQIQNSRALHGLN